MREMHFEKVVGSEIPTLKIIVIKKGGNIERECYMLPLRGYCFQVSSNTSGDEFLGSSCIIGLKHCQTIQDGNGKGFKSNYHLDEIQREMLAGQALLALNDFTSNVYKGYIKYPKLYGASNRVSKDTENFNQFIIDCDEWLKTL